MRGERITDITPSIQRALAVAPLTHLKARASADDRERGGATGAAPAAGNAEHDLHDLEQVDDATEHARAKRDADGEREDRNKRVEDTRSRVENVSHTGSVELGRRTPPINNYLPQRPEGWSRTDGVEPPERGDEPRMQTTAPCILREQRDQTRNDVRHDCERGRIEHIRRLYHSRPANTINRSATTTITTIASVTKSDSAINDDSTHQPHTA